MLQPARGKDFVTDLRAYSAMRVGKVWTESDHIFLVSHLDKVDALAQAAHNLRTITDRNRKLPVLPGRKQEVYP